MAVHDTQQLAPHSIYEHQRRCRDRAGRLDLARSFRRAASPPLQSHGWSAGRPMVLERSIHARRLRGKRWNRIYCDGARGAGSLRGAHTGNDARAATQAMLEGATSNETQTSVADARRFKSGHGAGTGGLSVSRSRMAATSRCFWPASSMASC
jgi:hypothetical protein